MGKKKDYGVGKGTKGNGQKEILWSAMEDGNTIKTSRDMPKYREAIIDPRKFTHYSLSPNSCRGRHKAIVYKSALGYDLTNYESLISQISDAIHGGEARMFEISNTQYGLRYSFYVSVTGPNGQTKDVVVVYQIDPGEGLPRLLTNYVL